MLMEKMNLNGLRTRVRFPWLFSSDPRRSWVVHTTIVTGPQRTRGCRRPVGTDKVFRLEYR